MSFANFMLDMQTRAKCPKCDKPFELMEQVLDPETGDLIIKVECHGETHHELVTKDELKDLELRRTANLEALKAAKKPKRRIVTIDEATRHFAKFKRLK